jgi:hypothetical protein
VSRIGVAVPAKSFQEVVEAAFVARDKLTIPEGRLVLQMEWLLEQRVRPHLKVEIDVRDSGDAELMEAHASFDVLTRVMKIRDTVLRGCILGSPEDIFTVCHEIGHASMHSEIMHFRRVSPNKLPKKHSDPEWQADIFAVAFIMGRSLPKNNPDQLPAMLRAGVPKEHAVKYLVEYRATQRSSETDARLDHYMQEVIQDGFDF